MTERFETLAELEAWLEKNAKAAHRQAERMAKQGLVRMQASYDGSETAYLAVLAVMPKDKG